MVLAAPTQQTIAIVVGVAIAIGWTIYLLANARRVRPEVGAEVELAPNRKPYLSDEQLEGPKLDRALRWGLLSLVVIAVGFPLYWLGEPPRQRGAERGFADRAIGDDLEHGKEAGGEALFATTEEGGFNCAGCHGAEGVGGSTNYTLTEPVLDDQGQPVLDEDGNPEETVRVVKWDCPPLNTALLRFSEDEVREIITYGRKGTPMPPWGLEGGGPMNTQQVDNLVAYIRSIQITPEDAKEQSDELLEQTMASGRYTSEGPALFDLFCARCHTQGWSYGEPGVPGGGAFGFNLTNGVEARQFPLEEDHVLFITDGSENEQQYGQRGVGTGRMPGFGRMLSEDQIRAIVEYERGL